MVEFALVAPFFFLLLIGAIELGMLFLATISMQHAVREGARFAVTGQAPGGNRFDAVEAIIQQQSMGFYAQVNPQYHVAAIQKDGSSSPLSNSFGSAEQLVVIRLDCTWPLITPMARAFFTDGNYKFSVAATMRNEAF